MPIERINASKEFKNLTHKIISGFVKLDPDKRIIVFTSDGSKLFDRQKVLVYLVALNYWPNPPWDAAEREIEEQTCIVRWALRPTLDEFMLRNIIAKRWGRYSVREAALTIILAEIDEIREEKKKKKEEKKETPPKQAEGPSAKEG
jgi:hypothetical protein